MPLPSGRPQARPTIFFGVPTLYAAMLQVKEAEKRYDLSSLRLCVSSGEALPAATLEAARGADAILFDGTLYTNDEMIAQGLLNKTGDRMHSRPPVQMPDLRQVAVQ